MANVFRIEQHPKKNAIVRALINQVPYDKIADEFGLSFGSVQRYASQRLRHNAAKALAKGDYDGAALLSRVEDTIVNVQKMYDACNDWLTDPTDHSRYNLEDRANELQVIYYEYYEDAEGNERTVKKKDNLQKLIDDVMGKRREAIEVNSKRTDPRQLILMTAQTLNKQLETLSKIAGVVKEVTNVDVNINMNTHLASNVIQIIQREVADPAVVQRIVEGLTHDA
ncbi:MAG: hypothetical protein EOM01_13140 [Spirochaetia bacterium]|nr:hypothetical protein [Spirochaetia bacterium]